jgi:hypothetical protein
MRDRFLLKTKRTNSRLALPVLSFKQTQDIQSLAMKSRNFCGFSLALPPPGLSNTARPCLWGLHGCRLLLILVEPSSAQALEKSPAAPIGSQTFPAG